MEKIERELKEFINKKYPSTKREKNKRSNDELLQQIRIIGGILAAILCLLNVADKLRKW
jgi:hypothetical protein